MLFSWPSACRSGVSLVCVQQCVAVWTDNLILTTWSEAIIIPVLNLDRNHSLSSSYIPLIRFVCKTMKWMSATHFLRSWRIETCYHIISVRSILDHLWKLDWCFQNLFFLCWYFIVLLIGKGVWWCGDIVSLELSTAGIFGVSCCYFFSYSFRIITSVFVFAVLCCYQKKMEHHKHWFWTVALAAVTNRVVLCILTRAAWRLLLCNTRICVCMHACVHSSVLVYTYVSTHAHLYICICIFLYKLVPLTCI